METEVTSFSQDNSSLRAFRVPLVSERNPLTVKYRALAAKTAGGSLAVFPPPHQYFFARDFTSNMGYAWARSWRGHVGLGIRQLPDDNSPYYPWMNAPPGTRQRMSLFLLLSNGPPAALLSDVRAFTHQDRFVPLPGFQQPYHVAVDSHHNAWLNIWMTDQVLRYDPKANTFTSFDIPTRGSEVRYVSLYEKDGQMKVVLPSFRTRKVTVMAFRSEADIAATKAQAAQ